REVQDESGGTCRIQALTFRSIQRDAVHPPGRAGRGMGGVGVGPRGSGGAGGGEGATPPSGSVKNQTRVQIPVLDRRGARKISRKGRKEPQRPQKKKRFPLRSLRFFACFA